jgi:hypothetical protein
MILRYGAMHHAKKCLFGFCTMDYLTHLTIKNLTQRGPDEAGGRSRRGGRSEGYMKDSTGNAKR